MSDFSCNNKDNLELLKGLNKENIEKTKKHPCYSEFAHKYARIHLPVAPKCNISCNYCNRKFDCLHETRPGVSSEVLNPKQALDKYILVKEKIDNLEVVGIAGPGDALANFPETKKTLELIKEYNSKTTFCLSTNGLLLPDYIDEIIELGVSHLTITINTFNPATAAKIYKYVYYQGKKYTGLEAGKILLEKQREGLELLKDKGILTKINIVMIKGVNEKEIPDLVKEVKKYAVFMTNIMPLIPADGSVFEDMSLVSNKELKDLRDVCSIDMKQMYHCQQCRADAVGLLSEDKSAEFRNCSKFNIEIDQESEESYYFAIASKNGKIIDQHFGHADRFLIYKGSKLGIDFVEERNIDKYCTDQQCFDREEKMENTLEMLKDCSVVLCTRIGLNPKKKLNEKGIEVMEMYELIEDGIKYYLGNSDEDKKSALLFK